MKNIAFVLVIFALLATVAAAAIRLQTIEDVEGQIADYGTAIAETQQAAPTQTPWVVKQTVEVPVTVTPTPTTALPRPAPTVPGWR